MLIKYFNVSINILLFVWHKGKIINNKNIILIYLFEFNNFYDNEKFYK